VTRLALLLAVAALLAPAGASAKELVAATVCGAYGCRTVTDRATLNEIPGGEDVTGLGAPAAYYRLNLVTAEPNGRRHGFTTYYVPSAKAMSWSEDGLYRLHPIYGQRANGVMRRITTGLEPYAAPRNLRSSRPSPWTDGKSELAHSPSTNLVESGFEPVRIAGRTLREESGRGVPWRLVALAGVGVLAAVSLVRILPFKS
jgi:hypothetical protein